MEQRGAYDYIVVGAGSAGCAVAGRLAEDPSVHVALIEAGPPSRGRLFEVPGLFPRQMKSVYDWDFHTEPETWLGGRRTYLPRGRVVGGTSAMNSMLYVRGNRADYDSWVAEGWSYDEVLPFFRRSEDNERGEDAYHGIGGPLRVSDARMVHPLLDAWVDATIEAGYSRNPDFNGEVQEGVGIYQVTQRNGLRCSSADAFVHPVLEQGNLDVIHSTLALRVVWEGVRAVGVEVNRGGDVRTLRATEEIILSGGAYLSPHVLLLSGVGPADELQAAGVGVVADLPDVGRNLQDHCGSLLALPTTTEHPLFGGDTSTAEALLYETGYSPLTWVEAGAFIRSRNGLNAPDVQFHATLGLTVDEGLGVSNRAGISFGPYVGRPASRGWVRLRTPEPYSKPRILHNFLSEESDRVATRDGLRRALEIATQPALRKHLLDLDAARRAELIPRSDSDVDLDEFIRRTAFAFYHPCGTCAIGTVTDTALRVRGVEGLRVADASVIPNEITGNTNAPSIMIGERAADLIKTGAPVGSGRTGDARSETHHMLSRRPPGTLLHDGASEQRG
jgi:choline dehydrogenase-like flavoprotein